MYAFVTCPHISAIDAEDQLYNTKDLSASLDRVEAVDFHSTVDVDGIRFTPYHAGHVLGAAMYFIEIAGIKVVVPLISSRFTQGSVHRRLFERRRQNSYSR
jgi:Cft2 family RNA processing exonuclease